jgi:predicted metal-binding protein
LVEKGSDVVVVAAFKRFGKMAEHPMAWRTLPDSVKADILAMVTSCGG